MVKKGITASKQKGTGKKRNQCKSKNQMKTDFAIKKNTGKDLGSEWTAGRARGGGVDAGWAGRCKKRAGKGSRANKSHRGDCKEV